MNQPDHQNNRKAPGRDSGLFPGESLDLPKENPKQYQNYGNNYGYGYGVRNYNNGYGGANRQWEDPWKDDEEPEQGGWDETAVWRKPEDWQEPEEDWQEPEENWQEPEEKPREPAIRAYNADFRTGVDQSRAERVRREPVRRQPPQEDADDLDEMQRYSKLGQAAAASRKKRRKRHHFFRNLLCILLVLCLLAVGLCFLLKKMPQAENSLGPRKENCATILLAGLDDAGIRTDTMMLLYLDGENGRINMLSLPRDTYIDGDYSVPKLNSVYGGNGCGEEGMEALLDQVRNLIGYRPDGYLLVELDAFIEIVDAMGGVEFDVPQDMYYDDGSQDLHIDLKAGKQKLNGEEAMGLVRFRSGYAMADLRRVEVQRDFVKAAMDQWLSLKNIFRYPGALKALLSHTTGNLSFRNLLWIADTVRKANLGELQTMTLPGEAAYIHGGSYYLVWPNATAELVNQYFNPYVRDITSADLNIAE